MSRINARLSAVRPALLGVALLLTMIAMISPAFAACTPGATRTIISNIACCQPTGAWATKQNQVCNSSGVWVNSGNSYCAPVSACAF
jgi:hypothetical protein